MRLTGHVPTIAHQGISAEPALPNTHAEENTISAAIKKKIANPKDNLSDPVKRD
jgi:hypothetical protein